MEKATMQERTLIARSGEKIVRAEIVDNGHGIRCYTIPEPKSNQYGSKEFEEMFPIVDIEGISLRDSFMDYDAIITIERRVRYSIIKAKNLGMKNFRKPCMDPSFAVDGETIIYCAGEKPAVGKSPDWWYENAPIFMPEKNSRLIDDWEKDVFLGTIIKYLVEEEKYSVEDAWKAVCVYSKDIGNYYEYDNPESDVERTGSRKLGKWYDLGNTYKIVKRHNDSVLLYFGGDFWSNPIDHPLAHVGNISRPDMKDNYSVGEIVLDV